MLNAGIYFFIYLFIIRFVVYSFGISAEVKGKHWYGNDSDEKLEWRPQDPVSTRHSAHASRPTG